MQWTNGSKEVEITVGCCSQRKTSWRSPEVGLGRGRGLVSRHRSLGSAEGRLFQAEEGGRC